MKKLFSLCLTIAIIFSMSVGLASSDLSKILNLLLPFDITIDKFFVRFYENGTKLDDPTVFPVLEEYSRSIKDGFDLAVWTVNPFCKVRAIANAKTKRIVMVTISLNLYEFRRTPEEYIMIALREYTNTVSNVVRVFEPKISDDQASGILSVLDFEAVLFEQSPGKSVFKNGVEYYLGNDGENVILYITK